ncbi:MAG: LuxR family transcriptional regulator, partial [Coriobacteriales bacterium]|nr:LuxR family transcriptional regulator [Coriobacteriales bacterium]
VLLPLLSLIFLIWGEQLIAAAVGIDQGDKPNILHSAAIEKVPVAESVGSREGRFFFEDKRSVYGLFVIIILWGLLNELSRTIYVKNGLVAGGESGFAIANNLSALIVTLLLLFLVVLLIAYPKRSNLVNVYRVALIVSVSSACLMPLVVVGGQAVFLPYAINTAAFRIFGCLMWVVITAVCTPERERTTQVFSWARACWAFGPLLGLLIGRWLFRVGASSDTGTIIVLAWILSVGYICGYLFAYNEEQVVKLTDFFPAAPRTKQLNLRCQIISRKYGLSERESEILTYLAKGRSAAFIQEQLVLSYSTVSTHRQHIYQKLGIHSQQELLDLVDKTIVE